MDPWPSAFTSIQGGGLRLFAPTRVLAETSGAQPGELIPPPKGHEDMMWTAAGQGALGLGQVQAAGKRRMAAAEFLRGARLGPGTRLGDS
jgi:methionyl-tRNA formyltransferase